MATLEECRAALTQLTEDIAEDGAKINFDRSLSARIKDLDVVLKGRFENGAFSEIEEATDPAADIKLTLTSDDLVAMCAGELNAMKAMATGRLKLDASLGDMMKLRQLLK
ncbi:sterol-binding protein [Epidermidibacterium keratini]|uniref:Sterol-binding protein n=1 Tax=Epidermidibacterium keratini TaxID=1891644 RepID=A0A7L4YHY3_9ACTN|nr:SCP2 sterol-binding domain-containing protein [Epidermidibacterium keratini]QHB98939.1 sterol-binding protein [Epidermidibacterium keratini]